MNEPEKILVGVNVDCLMAVMRFLKSQMSEDEIPAFAAHARDCCECQEYIDIISTLIANREEILKQLKKGGFHEH